MKTFFNCCCLLVLILIQVHSACSQEALGHIVVVGNDGKINLRIITVAEAQAAGNGVMKIVLGDGTIGAADLVPTSHTLASPIRIQTPYGVRSWKKESQYAYAYGGENSDLFTGMAITDDGGFALGGYTNSWGAGSYDQLLVKTNASGTQSWAGVYGGTESENGKSVIQRTEGGYVLLGTKSNGPIHYMYLNFINSTGSSTLSGYFQPATGYTSGNDVIQCTDGNFVGAGYADGFGAGGNDVYVKKFDSTGSSIWGKAIGTTYDEVGREIVQRPDGGYVIVGYKTTESSGENAYFLMIDSDGESEISYSIGGTGSDNAEAVCKSVDDGYVFVGKTSSYGDGDWNFYLVKRNAAGSGVWSKTFGGTGDDLGEDITSTDDGGFAITGKTTSFGAGGIDLWLIKTDSLGNPQWSWVFGGTGNDNGYAVQQGEDGCYYVSGITNSYGAGGNDGLLVKFTPDGESCLGYAVGFSSEMQALDENNSTFKARRVDEFVTTNIQLEDKIIYPKSTVIKDRLQVDSTHSRDFITPATTSVCD